MEKTMSRSRKKTPIIGHTKADSDKPFKVQEHKRERRVVKHILTSAIDHDNMVLPDKEQYGNDWESPKDGKCWRDNPKDKWMRK